MQSKEMRMWKEWIKEAPTSMDGSWEPVCVVRDKPEKQNLVHLGRGGEESCFQVIIHVKIAVCFPSGCSSAEGWTQPLQLKYQVMWENIAPGCSSLIVWAPSAHTWLNQHVLSEENKFLINTFDVQGM